MSPTKNDVERASELFGDEKENPLSEVCFWEAKKIRSAERPEGERASELFGDEKENPFRKFVFGEAKKIRSAERPEGERASELFGDEKENPLSGVSFAEAKRFELLVGYPTAVFKTAALDHSATPPFPGVAKSL